MNLLRFITAGSVDDGKSTLIGRLLHDSKNIFADQLEALERQSRARQAKGIDFSLLTDGLRAEREQGITIDVAYKYFNTPKRKFIIIDAPGHIQYTRNMVTGASNAQLIIILIDARHGVVEQTRRHAAIAGLLDIPRVVVAINKMDLVSYSQDRYDDIVGDFSEVARALKLRKVSALPVSALLGDNIVERSAAMPWYDGMPLLSFLEEVEIDSTSDQGSGRLSVQYVIHPVAGEGRRYAGTISSGVFRKDALVTVLPSGVSSRIAGIEAGGLEVEEAGAQQSVALRLEGHVDISRGDLLITGQMPRVDQEMEMLVCWMDEKPLQAGNRYLLQAATRMVRCVVRSIENLLDIDTMEERSAPSQVVMNAIVRVRVRTSAPIAYDPFSEVRGNGCAILIDETSYATAGACIML